MYDFKNKTQNINTNNKYMLAKTLSMFEYVGLPESIPYNELENILQCHGFAFITEVEGVLYAFKGNLGGELDVYGKPTQITINNTYLNFNKTLNIADDGVLIRSDDYLLGLIPLLNKYNTFLVENDINIMLNGYNSRIQNLISAGDDKTKASAESYLNKIVEGELGIIGESALFEGVKLQNTGGSRNTSITDLIEAQQYLKATMFNELGLSANFNMKRERLNSDEVSLAEDSLFPFVDNMMKCRIKGIEQVNEKYGLSIDIDYGSVWYNKSKELVDDVIEVTPDEPQDETQDDPQDETQDEPLTDLEGQEGDLSNTNQNEPNNETKLDELLLQQSLNLSENSIENGEKIDAEISEIETILLNDDLTDADRTIWESLLADLRGDEVE